MGKISKNSNLYDKDSNLLKHVNEDGVLEDHTTKELEELLQTFVEDNKIIDQEKYDNVMSILMQRYQTANDEDSIFKRIEEYIKTKTTSETEVQDALNQVKESLKTPVDESTIEEIKDDESGETVNTGEVQEATESNNTATEEEEPDSEEVKEMIKGERRYQ